MARDKQAGKATGQHAEALTGIWRWAFAPSPSAALRRRIALGLLIAAFLGLLFTFRAQGTPIWLALITPASLSHLLIAVFVFWLALNAAVVVLQVLFPAVSAKDARRQVLRTALGGNYDSLHTYGAEGIWEYDHSVLAQSGGPGWLKVHLENAAITERADGSARVLGPSPRPVLLDGFERMRTVLHLKEQVLTLDIWARSRDGIRVRVEGTRLVYSLLRGKHEPSLKQPYPFDAKAALDLVYGQRVEQTVRSVMKVSGGNLVAEQGEAFFERQLQEFIGQFTLGELLAGPPEDSGKEFSGRLFLARDKLREAFIARSREPAAALGLQVNWVDIGTWKLDERARAALAGSEGDAGIPSAQPQEDELAALIEQLLPDALEQLGEAWIDEALSNFEQLFSELREKYEELKTESEPPELATQLESVIRFLNLLTKKRAPMKDESL